MRCYSQFSSLLRTVPSKTKLSNYAGKADLSNGCWDQKLKLGVNKHFLEIRLNLAKTAIQCYVYCFFELSLLYYL